MRSLNLQDSKSERLSNVSRVLLLALVSTSFLIFPTSGVESARASSPDPALINFNDGTCDLTTAGYSGIGSSADPYLIPDADALWEVADCSITASAPANFRITNNITVSDAVKAPTSSPIGFSTSSLVYSFSGVLDGGTHSINSIGITTSDYGAGLFGFLHDAEIKRLAINGSVLTTTNNVMNVRHAVGGLAIFSSGDLKLDAIVTSVDVSGKRHAGGLVGYVQDGGASTFSNIVNSGAVSGEFYVGGVVGWSGDQATFTSVENGATISGSRAVGGVLGFGGSNTTFSSASNSGLIRGDEYLGGLVGWFSGTNTVLDIQNSHNSGTVSGKFWVGGLAGWVVTLVRVNNSINTGSIIGTATNHGYVGGLVGQASTTNILMSINRGSVAGVDYVGGLLGDAINATVESSVNSGVVIGADDFVGGTIGRAGRATISSTVNSGDVSGNLYVGGLVGQAVNSIYISNSTNSGSITGTRDVGGMVGYSNAIATVRSSQNSGSILASSVYVSGFAGRVISTAVFIDSWNSGSVSGTDWVAGFLGWGIGTSNFDSSTNSGSVVASGTSFGFSGGFVGQAGGAIRITDSANVGPITGNNYVGGFAGQAFSTADFSGAKNSGSISGQDFVGGFAGFARSHSALVSLFNTGNVAGRDFVGGLIGQAGQTSRIESATNTGSIFGTGVAVAGLVGASSESMSVINASNLGAVSGIGAVGGLIGRASESASMTTVFNSGLITALNDGDGLIGSSSSIVNTASALSSQDSNFVQSSQAEDLKIVTTYVGFDFVKTWGFGSCTDNQGFPMLRIFGEISNYNSVACGYTPPPQSGPSPGSTPAPVPVLQPLPVIDQNKIQTAAGNQQLLTGKRFELIRSATINGLAATISQLTATSLMLSIPELVAGNYTLDLETSNGRISFQGLVEIGEASLNPAQLGSTFSVITGLNPRSSWLNKAALAELEEIFKGQSVVTCISYNNRPGLVARKKALSRAMHACRIADQLGIETRVFVFGKAPDSADTVKILFG